MDVVAPDMPKTAANYNIMAKVWDDNVAVARTTHDLTSMAKTAGLTDCKVIRKEVSRKWAASQTLPFFCPPRVLCVRVE